MYNCPKCKEPFEDGTKFCQKCGCNIEENFLLNPVCPNCGKKFPSGTTFCDEDGKQLTTQEKLIPKCVKCNREYPSDTKFCPEDGGAIIPEAFRSSTDVVKKYSRNNLQKKGYSAKEINDQFTLYTWLYWGGLAGSIILIGIPVFIAAFVIGFIIQYKAWTIIQEKARTTPGKAIGFQFIPFFNFYWIFVAYKGLAEDINKYNLENNVNSPPVSEDKGLWIGILYICSIIPFVNIVIGIAQIIVMFLFMQDVKNAIKQTVSN
jgi:hypothetical protein|tara:strand:- start:1060 stop:1845 length:786 start_codon:yes stop_codon:yes gene_type:complete